MDITKKIIKKLTFIYLVAFPFGQILGFIFNVYFPNFPTIHFSDLLILLIAVLTVITYHKNLVKTKWLKIMFTTSLVILFGFLLSIFSLNINPTLGLLYLIRFFSYLIFFASIFFTYKNKSQKSLLINSLMIISIFIAIGGWLQYLWLPDLTTLKLLNWDDHFYRLVGTFLDPTFTGILLVFGFLISFIKFLESKNKNLLLVNIFLLITIFFTYSRSSLLALLTSIFFVVLSKLKNKLSASLIIVLVSILGIFLLPKSVGGEGVNLLRTNSIVLKINNSKQAIEVIKENPLFGVGYNNVCSVNMVNSDIGEYSHSCSGFDNSFVFVLASTGIVGSLVLCYLFYVLWTETISNFFGLIWKASAVALVTHTMFTNTIFYAWVLGWFAILTGISRKKST